MREISRRQFIIGMIAALLLQYGIVALFFFDVILDPDHPPLTFHFHHGGDEKFYFTLSQDMARGTLSASKYSLGLPVWMLPWIRAIRPATHYDITGPMAAFHALVLFPLGQWILAALAQRLLRKRTAALMTVLLWTALPLLLYLPMALTGRAALGATWAVHLTWLQMLTEPPAAFLTLLSFRYIFALLDTQDKRRELLIAAALGGVCGWLLLFRINGIISVAVIGLLLVLSRRWRSALVWGAITACVFSPQLIYNAAFFGSPLTTGYQVYDDNLPHGLFSVDYLLEIVRGEWGLLIVVIAILLSLLIAAGAFVLWRRDRQGGLAMGGWFGSYVIFFAFYYFSWVGGWTRFLIPAYPALAVLIVAIIDAGWRWLRPAQNA